MMIRGLIAGVLIGFALGWVAFHEGAHQTERRTETRPQAEQRPEPEAPRIQPPRQEAAASRKRSTIFLGSEPVVPRPMAEIDAALATARADKNWNDFYRALLELVVAASPEADRRLVSLMGDESLALYGPWIGKKFYDALHDSPVEGIGAAARKRAQMELKDKAGSRWQGVGFMSLVAQYGSDEDHAWLESLATSRNRSQEVDRAFAEGARSPAAAQRMRKRILDADLRAARHWDTFAKLAPDVAFEAARELIVRQPDNESAYRLLGEAATEESLPEVHNLLLGLTDDTARILSIRAIDQMKRRNLDVGGYETILEVPRRVLEESLAGRETKLLSPAMAAISTYSILWDEATVSALQTLADRGNARAAAQLKKLNKRRSRASAQKWEPDRGG